MGFLFPLFLLAGLAILIPVIIHLVNLRRYRREVFPNIRFLRRLQIVSKRSAKLYKKWLLLSRILFILALVLAFAHPFWKKGSEAGKNNNGLVVVFVDNSRSMSVQSAGNTLLSLAKNRALEFINSSPADTRFIILSNSRQYLGLPVDKQEARQVINNIQYSGRQVSFSELKNMIAAGMTIVGEKSKPPVYLFSDFQAATWLNGSKNNDSLALGDFYLFPVISKETENVFFDSVSVQKGLLNNTTAPIRLFIRLGRQNTKGRLTRSLRLMVDGQTRLVKTITFPEKAEYLTDTLTFSAESEDWTKVTLLLSDAAVSFDDTFRLVIKAPIGFSAMVLTDDGKVSPYLQAAFQSMPAISPKNLSTNELTDRAIADYSLIVVQDGNEGTPRVGKILKKAMEEGANVLIFAGKGKVPTKMEQMLEILDGIRLGTPDTTESRVAVLQSEHPLLKDIFESVPQQVELPVAHYHFPLSAGWTSNQQNIMSFQDGNPLLAGFHLDVGNLYVCTVPLDGESSNFPLSYFFAPLLYNMAISSGTLQQYFTTAGSTQPVWIPAGQSEAAGHQIWHLQKRNFDQAPSQHVEGRGLAVYVGRSAEEAGFYWLKQEGNEKDSIWLAVNDNPSESRLQPASGQAIENALEPQKVFWLDEKITKNQGWMPSSTSFPLWKIAICIAILCLLFETLLLLNPKMKKKGDAQKP